MNDQEYLAKLTQLKLRQRASPRNETAAARIRGFGEGITGSEELSGSPLDNDPMRGEAEAARNLGKWISIGSDAPLPSSAALKAGLLVPIIAGRNKVPKIAADLEKRALSAAQMQKAGKDEDAIWKALQVSPTPRTAPETRGPLEGAFRHEISTPHGEDLISPYAAMGEPDKIEKMIEWAAKSGDPNVQKTVDRWAMDETSNKLRKTSSRWHRDPADEAMARLKARQLADTEPGGQGVLAALRNMQSNTIPLAGKSTVADLNFGSDFAQQYPELARMNFETYQNLAKRPGEYGSYGRNEDVVRLHPATMIGDPDKGFDPTSVAVHETGHGVQQHFDAPSGGASGKQQSPGQKLLIRNTADALRVSNDPIRQRIGTSILRNLDLTPHQQYSNIYGEVDANNMAARELLTPNQRASQSPRATMQGNPEDLMERQTKDILDQMTLPNSSWITMSPEEKANLLMSSLRTSKVVP